MEGFIGSYLYDIRIFWRSQYGEQLDILSKCDNYLVYVHYACHNIALQIINWQAKEMQSQLNVNIFY